MPHIERRDHTVVPRHIAVAVLAMLVGWAVLLVRYRSWIATDDHAIFQLTLERFVDGHVPIVGAYSRLNFRHPGPAREWLFIGPYLLSGGRSAALPATTIVLHVALLAASIRAGWRWAGARGAATATCAVAVMFAGYGKQLAIPWNPFLASTMVFAALWGLLAFLRAGGGWQAVFCASAAAQMHASASLVAGSILLVVFGVALQRYRAALSRPRAKHAPVALLFTLLWSGPLIDAAKGSTSNLAAMARAGSSDETVGLVDALALTGRLLDPYAQIRGRFLRPDIDVLTTSNGLIATGITILVILVLLLAGRRASDHGATRSVAVMAGLAVVVVLSISRFVPPLFGYIFSSMAAASIVAMSVLSSSAISLAGDHLPVMPGRCTPARLIVGTAIGVLAVGTVVAVRQQNRVVDERRQLAVAGAVGAVVERGVEYDIDAAGMVGALLHAEVAVAVERSGGHATSDLFQLALEPSDTRRPLLLTVMSAPRQCVQRLGVGTVVLDGLIVAVNEPVTVLLIEPADRQTVHDCLAP